MYIFARDVLEPKNHCNCYKTVTKELNKNTLNKKNMSLLIYLLYYSTTKIHSSGLFYFIHEFRANLGHANGHSEHNPTKPLLILSGH